jgi:hypothetical protein
MSANDVLARYIAPAASDDNGISTAATLSGAGNLTINGALADGGSVTLDDARQVIITSAGDDSGDTFTVTGTDEVGNAQTEAITGADTGVATGSKYFTTITQIAASGASAGNVEAGTGTSVAAKITNNRVRLRGLQYVCNTTGGTVEVRNSSATGTVLYKFDANNVDDTVYPDIPDGGILFSGGAYVVYTQTNLQSLTMFYEG